MGSNEVGTDPVFIPDDDPGWPAYEQNMDEYRESQDAELQDWLRRSLDYLWESCGRTLPWEDAVPENEKTGSEESSDAVPPSAG